MRALATVLMVVVPGAIPPSESTRQAMTNIVARIQRADYEDDRKALRSLASDLLPYTETGQLASRALYWRGFAMWRRAMNGFNDSAEPKELQSDLAEAVSAFTDAAAKDPQLADARAAASACLYSLAFLNKDDVERRKAYIKQGVKLLDEARKAAPENPRVLWVQGGGGSRPSSGAATRRRSRRMREDWNSRAKRKAASTTLSSPRGESPSS